MKWYVESIVLILQLKYYFLEELFVETPPELVSNYFFYHMKQNGVFDKIKGNLAW